MGKVYIKGCPYETSETEDKHIFKDVSDNVLKVNFSFSKNKKDNEKAEEALRVFFTEIFS
ncbi:hypothetical protein ACM26V_16965 [Salipaludibacillus sp. HK11]|uniref:hypothetical protein n=1 Tax=Salipaludibacillus sp. HK11 TaxID=3394320 RepID=UPI0039FD7703